MQGYACDQQGTTGIVEDNKLWISADQKSATGITEEEFNSILDRVEELYTPIIEEFGATLNVDRNWENGTVNAYARQDRNNLANLNVWWTGKTRDNHS